MSNKINQVFSNYQSQMDKIKFLSGSPLEPFITKVSINENISSFGGEVNTVDDLLDFFHCVEKTGFRPSVMSPKVRSVGHVSVDIYPVDLDLMTMGWFEVPLEVWLAFMDTPLYSTLY